MFRSPLRMPALPLPSLRRPSIVRWLHCYSLPALTVEILDVRSIPEGLLKVADTARYVFVAFHRKRDDWLENATRYLLAVGGLRRMGSALLVPVIL